MTRLSHSALNKYKGCPAQYKLHYIDRIRSNKIGSALLFGAALDEALNRLLMTKMDEVPEEATDNIEALKQGFDYYFTYQKINGEQEDVRTSHFIEYFGSDFDPDILDLSDMDSLRKFIRDAGYISDPDDENSAPPEPLELYDLISGYIKAKQQINSTDQSFYNYCSWLSLRRKGHMMLEYYKEEIMPIIKRVESVQKAVELPNESGDVLIGYIDFEAEIEGYEGVITLDNKTSSKLYKQSDINDKGQLLIYDEYTENGKAGYVVLLKKIKYHKEATCQKCGAVTNRPVKSCPEGGTGKNRCGGKLDVVKIPYLQHQILVDDIDEEKKDLHFEVICDILEGIENEEFPQNRDSCFQFGRKCVYYDLCRSDENNPDYTGLVRV